MSITMRIVEQLDDEDWDKIVATLEEGPTEDQKKIMEKARKAGERFKIPE